MLAGDLEQLAAMVNRRAAALALYARQWLDQASAEDVVQEALAALLAERRPPDDPVAWMFRAVRNAAIDQVRSASRRRRREQAAAQARHEWFEPRPDAAIDARTAESVLRQLPEPDRQIVLLRIWGGLGWAQIAPLVGLALSTAHERYTAALERMRLILEKPCNSRNRTA
jgi:RNA polymerase sigma-70 factor (ECF subfamily)